MGWGEQNARFYCEVHSARQRVEKILSNERKGLVIIAAGEYGSLRVELKARSVEENVTVGPRGGRTYKRRNIDHFTVEFCPWRSCDKPGPSIMIATGPLDYDRVKYGDALVRFDDQAVEVYRTMRAIEILKERE